MNRQWILGCAFGLVLFTACSDDSTSSGVDCGPGTNQVEGECVPIVSCGDGTIQADTLCVPDDDHLVCGEGTTAGTDDAGNAACVPTGEQCGDGTELVGGVCVPTDVTACGDGTELNENNECIAIVDMFCGEGTELNDDGDACLARCGGGEVWDVASQSCVSECGQGTEYDVDQGVCAPLCVTDEYFVPGVGCVHVPECLDGSIQDPVSEDCEAWPFDELSLDRLCARRAVRYCEQHLNCCNGYGTYSSINDFFSAKGGVSIDSFLRFGYSADMAGCLAREVTVCEAGVSEGDDLIVPGVGLIRHLVGEGAVTVSPEAVAEFDAIWDTDEDVCFVDATQDELFANPFGEAAVVYGFDLRLPDAILALSEANRGGGQPCDVEFETGIGVCRSDRCINVRGELQCSPRIPETTYTGEGDPEIDEICNRARGATSDPNQCVEDTLCTLTYFPTDEGEIFYELCTPPKSEGERCEEFATLNPCDEGMVCRRDIDLGPDALPRCHPLGRTGDTCLTSLSYETCADTHWCTNEVLGRDERCEPLRLEFQSCEDDTNCLEGLVCRPPTGWENAVSVPSFSCRTPIEAGQACAVEVEFDDWCGPDRYCNDEANACDEGDITCGTPLTVGNCLPAIVPGDSCFFCEWNTTRLNGCAATDLCWINGDSDGEATPVCNSGVPICTFNFSDLVDLCDAP